MAHWNFCLFFFRKTGETILAQYEATENTMYSPAVFQFLTVISVPDEVNYIIQQYFVSYY